MWFEGTEHDDKLFSKESLPLGFLVRDYSTDESGLKEEELKGKSLPPHTFIFYPNRETQNLIASAVQTS